MATQLLIDNCKQKIEKFENYLQNAATLFERKTYLRTIRETQDLLEYLEAR